MLDVGKLEILPDIARYKIKMQNNSEKMKSSKMLLLITCTECAPSTEQTSNVHSQYVTFVHVFVYSFVALDCYYYYQFFVVYLKFCLLLNWFEKTGFFFSIAPGSGIIGNYSGLNGEGFETSGIGLNLKPIRLRSQ